MSEQRKALIENLKNNSLTKLAPSNIVENQVGVFARVDIQVGIDPFELCNTVGISTEEFSEKILLENLGEFSHVMESIKTFIIPIQKDNEKFYHIPITGLNSLDLSFYLNTQPVNDRSKCNCILTDDHDERGYRRIITTRKIPKGEELLIYYPISKTPKCIVCDIDLRDHEQNHYNCACPVNRCLECQSKTLLQNNKIETEFEEVSGEHNSFRLVSSSAKCDICKEPVSELFLRKLLKDPNLINKIDNNIGKRERASSVLAESIRSPVTNNNKKRKSTLPLALQTNIPRRSRDENHDGLTGLAWMAEVDNYQQN